MTHMLFTLLQAGYYAEPSAKAVQYSGAQMGMFVLIIVIGVVGYIVQARLQAVFRKYSKVQFTWFRSYSSPRPPRRGLSSSDWCSSPRHRTKWSAGSAWV